MGYNILNNNAWDLNRVYYASPVILRTMPALAVLSQQAPIGNGKTS
jgi:hypothetical protein